MPGVGIERRDEKRRAELADPLARRRESDTREEMVMDLPVSGEKVAQDRARQASIARTESPLVIVARL